MDLAASNLDMLGADHWLKDAQNIMLLRLESKAWVDAPGGAAQ